jgi:hypothetical protein
MLDIIVYFFIVAPVWIAMQLGQAVAQSPSLALASGALFFVLMVLFADDPPLVNE